MDSFLISINARFKVSEVFWSEPVFLLSKHMNSFLDLFDDNDLVNIKATINQCRNLPDGFQYAGELTLSGHHATMSMWFLSAGEGILAFALSGHEKAGDMGNAFNGIVFRFMQTIKKSNHHDKPMNQESVSSQFENIQRLNNELINTRRMLEKANAQLKVLNQELNNRLVKDALTGLVSRYQYRQEMEMVISNTPEKMGLFMFIDIDDFKSVNDNFGHAVGDEYLIQFSDRLKALPVHEVIRIRISGDEFGLFIYGFDHISKDDMDNLWDMMKEHILSSPVAVKNMELPISISAGIAIYGIHTKEIYNLIEYADYAMYCAKRNGKNKMKVFDKDSYNKAKGNQL